MSEDHKIKIGSLVRLYWVNGNELEGELKYMPQATGDLLHIVDDRGETHYINTGCSSFEEMIELTRTNKGE